jgi:hypothetical protein
MAIDTAEFVVSIRENIDMKHIVSEAEYTVSFSTPNETVVSSIMSRKHAEALYSKICNIIIINSVGEIMKHNQKK